MALTLKIGRFVCFVGLAVLAVGCRTYGLDSMRSTMAPNETTPYKGDPYTWAGVQDGTGGLVAATKQTMETESYSEPKFKKLAGPAGFSSMSGWQLRAAKPSDIPGDYQPLHRDASHAADPAIDHVAPGKH